MAFKIAISKQWKLMFFSCLVYWWQLILGYYETCCISLGVRSIRIADSSCVESSSSGCWAGAISCPAVACPSLLLSLLFPLPFGPTIKLHSIQLETRILPPRRTLHFQASFLFFSLSLSFPLYLSISIPLRISASQHLSKPYHELFHSTSFIKQACNMSGPT